MKKPFTYEEFKSIYSKIPRLSVDAVIVAQDGIIMAKRSLESYQGQWQLPGGTLYMHEKVEDAAARHALEETGLTVSVGRLLGYIEYHSEEKERGFGYAIGLAMECTVTGGVMQVGDESSMLQTVRLIPRNTVIDQKTFLASIGHKASPDDL